MPITVRRFLPQALIVVSLLVALTAAGFGAAMGISSHSGTKPPPVVLRWANENTSDLLTLDPAGGLDLNSSQAAQLIFGGLVRLGPGFQIQRDAARSWTISDAGRVYTFYLRPNVRFGDGSRLTAQDVAYSLNRTLSPQFAEHSGAFVLGDIEGAAQVRAGRAARASGIQALSVGTLRIRLRAPSATFLERLATPAGYIVPPQAIRKDPKRWYRQAFGTGPFMVARWIPGKRLLLVANPYYWAGKPHIDSIDMPFVPEPLEAYKLYRSGSLDIMGTIRFPPEALYGVEGQPDFHRSQRLETVHLTLNERRAPFNNMLVRQAFAHAIDRTAVVRNVYYGFAHPTTVMMPPGLPGYSSSLKGAEYDPELARQLLARAGYADGRGLPPITYDVDAGALNLALATALAAQWHKALNVQVKVVPHTHSDYLLLLDRRAYQIAVIDWTLYYPDPENILTQTLRSGSPNNNGGWSNHTFDRLVDQAATMPATSPARLALYRRADELAMNQAAVIPLVNPTAGILVRPGVRGLTIERGQVLARDWTRVTVSRSAPL